MNLLRAFFQRRYRLAFALVIATLCMKALVPAGFMVGQHSRTLTIEICHDGLSELAARQLVVPVKGDAGEPSGKQAKGECPFTALSMASLSGADTALLAARRLGLPPF